MVADQIGAAVGVVAVVFPRLDPQHPLGGLGHQGGVFAKQIGPVYLELVAKLRHHQRDQAFCDRAQAPAVLRQEPLPAAEIPLVEEGTAGQARHTFAALDHHQGPHIGLGSRQSWGP